MPDFDKEKPPIRLVQPNTAQSFTPIPKPPKTVLVSITQETVDKGYEDVHEIARIISTAQSCNVIIVNELGRVLYSCTFHMH